MAAAMNLLFPLLLLLPAIHCDAVSDWQPMRIHLHYDATVESVLDADAAAFAKKTLRAVADFYQDALSVRRDSKPLRLSPGCESDSSSRKCVGKCAAVPKCNKFPIPKEHLLPCVTCPSKNSPDAECSVDGVKGNSSATDDGANSSAGVPNADLIIYVSAIDDSYDGPGECNFGEATRTKLCRQEPAWNRPNAATMVFRKRFFDDKEERKNAEAAFKHEFLHIFGLHKDYFKYFWKNETTPYTKREAGNTLSTRNGAETKITSEVTRTDWTTKDGKRSHTVTMLVTPRVKREIRHHFGCPELEGVELENYRRDVGHFEARIFRSDLFTNNWVVGSELSRLSFAFLEDSGWYKADYSKAARMPSWQKNIGCDYAKESCGEWIKNKKSKQLSLSPFCDESKSRMCTADRKISGECNFYQWELMSIPDEYQYFSKGDDWGGYNEQADVCPYVEDYMYTCSDASSVGDSKFKAGYMQEFVADSRCIDFVGWQKDGADYDFRAAAKGGCYKTECSNGQLKIHVNGTTHTCTKAGEEFSVESTVNGANIKGTLKCPAHNEICPGAVDDAYLSEPLEEIPQSSDDSALPGAGGADSAGATLLSLSAIVAPLLIAL